MDTSDRASATGPERASIWTATAGGCRDTVWHGVCVIVTSNDFRHWHDGRVPGSLAMQDLSAADTSFPGLVPGAQCPARCSTIRTSASPAVSGSHFTYERPGALRGAGHAIA